MKKVMSAFGGKKITFLLFAIFLIAAGCSNSQSAINTNNNTSTSTGISSAPASTISPVAETPSAALAIVFPISNAKARITKKPFGIKVSPSNSPVQPEKFSGYHTGLDFETFPEEQNTDVSINVICSGKLLQKGYASGYGGYAVQSCVINNQTVTVIYGHLRQASIKPAVGNQLTAGDFLAFLGTGYSKETDNERKHLHLGIHKGSEVNIKGYVQNKNDLSAWLDPQTVLGL